MFRYRRVIETEIFEERDHNYNSVGNNNELMVSSAGPPLIFALNHAIEHSTLLHLEFWSELGEDTPDLGKL